MKIIEKKIIVKDYLTKSNLPASDYVINPYVGCPHACKYCYASFMKRFTKHEEKWGDFIDIKECDKPIDIKKLNGKSLFISSVTDCYNQFEEKYMITRKILEQLVDADCRITISTKSNLIYISSTYPDLIHEYQKIYIHKDMTYWYELAVDLDDYCNKQSVKYKNYFYHEKLVEENRNSI